MEKVFSHQYIALEDGFNLHYEHIFPSDFYFFAIHCMNEIDFISGETAVLLALHTAVTNLLLITA